MDDPVDRFTAVYGMAFALVVGVVSRDWTVGAFVAGVNSLVGLAVLRLAPWLRGTVSRPVAFVGAILPPLAFFVFYRESMLALGAPGLAFQDAALVLIERGATATIPTIPSRWLGEVLAFGYVAYVPLLVIATIALFAHGARGPAAPAMRALRRICWAWGICFVLYLAFPVLGPRFLDPGLQALRLGEGPFSRAALANHSLMLRGGAFPSAHVAATTVVLIALWTWRRSWFWPLLPIGVALGTGAVYLGYHYVADVVAGALVGAAVSSLDSLYHGPVDAEPRPLER